MENHAKLGANFTWKIFIFFLRGQVTKPLFGSVESLIGVGKSRKVGSELYVKDFYFFPQGQVTKPLFGSGGSG